VKTEVASSRVFSEAAPFFLSTGSTGVHGFHALAYDLRTARFDQQAKTAQLTEGDEVRGRAAPDSTPRSVGSGFLFRVEPLNCLPSYSSDGSDIDSSSDS